jgi:hypothetical protein
MQNEKRDFKSVLTLNCKVNEIKTDGAGMIEAYVSIFNNIDSYGDIIAPGAFAESIGKKLPKVVWSHDWEKPIGKTLVAREDNKGLYVKAQLLLSIDDGRKAYELIKEGIIDEFSIGFRVQDWEMQGENRVIKKVKLYEWSPVLAGANPATELVSIKGEDIDEDFDADKGEDAGKASDGQGDENKAIKDESKTGGDGMVELKLWDETDNEIAYRVKDPALFQDGSFRTIQIKKDKPRVNGIVGKLKDEDTMTLQSLRFPKEDGWTMDDAKQWVEDHPDIKIGDEKTGITSDEAKELISKIDALIAALQPLKELAEKAAGEGIKVDAKAGATLRLRAAAKEIDKKAEMILRLTK